MVEERTSDGIIFKKGDKKVLKVQTDRFSKAIKYLRSKTLQK